MIGRYSREAIAEFQFVASRWDASQGRSNGVLVNAVTKSGNNTTTGSVAGYFRSDRFNAPDRVLVASPSGGLHMLAPPPPPVAAAGGSASPP